MEKYDRSKLELPSVMKTIQEETEWRKWFGIAESISLVYSLSKSRPVDMQCNYTEDDYLPNNGVFLNIERPVVYVVVNGIVGQLTMIVVCTVAQQYDYSVEFTRHVQQD